MLQLSLLRRVDVEDCDSDSAGAGTQNAVTHRDSDASSSSGDSDSNSSDSDIEMTDTKDSEDSTTKAHLRCFLPVDYSHWQVAPAALESVSTASINRY